MSHFQQSYIKDIFVLGVGLEIFEMVKPSCAKIDRLSDCVAMSN